MPALRLGMAPDGQAAVAPGMPALRLGMAPGAVLEVVSVGCGLGEATRSPTLCVAGSLYFGTKRCLATQRMGHPHPTVGSRRLGYRVLPNGKPLPARFAGG